ncbi:phosphate acetyltransferase [Sulfurimonas aquatica]|uniref:Phosphate acetyltransferase n=1 Tax=Sulfurimonas aquatica TaxID=2672570 RepID=A0A975AZ29_9BACT|nr:phosphate acetyltransferase [Sulfurimonas aquatica]QSZ41189.1 phosphate acetyltransferase [Sulfurimonas aquatica]
MKTKSLFISAHEINSGMLFVSMGMMEILKRKLPKVAFFRPVIYKKDVIDGDIEFITSRYELDIEYKDCFGFDIEYVESMIASNKTKQLINQLMVKFKKLESTYDFVLCEGIRQSFLSSNINFDLNIKIAQNFGSPYINIINAKENSAHDVYESILIENETLVSQGCTHFATFVNRLSSDKKEFLEEKLDGYSYKTYLLNEVEELSLLSIQDVIESLKAKTVLLSAEDHTRSIRNVKIAAMSLDNFLEKIEEDDLIVVPADRSEIILGLYGALYSRAYPNISCIVFPFDMKAHPNIDKLIFGLDKFNIPILSVETDTYQTARALTKVHSRIRVSSDRKIALGLGLFNSNVDSNYIEDKIATTSNSIMTPIMFEYKLFALAGSNKKRIVLPESSDERILRAAEIALHRGVADIILLGKEVELRENSLRLGLDLSKATIIDHCNSVLMKKFVDTFYEMRKEKGLTRGASADAMIHENYFATMMVQLGYADGMVSGAIHSTGDTIRPALQIIKTKPGVSVVSSVFFMCLETQVLVYGDCAINQDPDSKTLADIAIASAKTASSFGIEPRVAMLSYSTGYSGSGVDVDKVREATNMIKERDKELLIEGPIQYDAAINMAVAKKKLPDSKVAGRATVFIFPDLNTGNNTYKAVQRSSNAVAIGPILQGLNKPVNDLSRGCLVEDIVNTIAITAIQAGQE